MDSRPPGDSLYYSETGMTGLQENPVYANDLEDGTIDMGMFKGDRDVSEMELYDSGDVVGPPYAVTGIVPNRGPVTGGITIAIEGLDFVNQG